MIKQMVLALAVCLPLFGDGDPITETIYRAAACKACDTHTILTKHHDLIRSLIPACQMVEWDNGIEDVLDVPGMVFSFVVEKEESAIIGAIDVMTANRDEFPLENVEAFVQLIEENPQEIYSVEINGKEAEVAIEILSQTEDTLFYKATAKYALGGRSYVDSEIVRFAFLPRWVQAVSVEYECLEAAEFAQFQSKEMRRILKVLK